MATEEKIKEEGNDTRKDEDEVQKTENDTVVPARYLDESILFNIFTRIPADLLHTNHFKYQCKQWRRLISNEYFMDIHNENISQFKPGIIYLEQVDSGLEDRYLLKYMELSRSEILRVRTLHDFGTTEIIIKSSCNGLLLLEEESWPQNLYRIMNPITKKQTTYFPAEKNSDFCELVFLGEYKVVELYDPIEDDLYGSYSRSCSYALRITTLNGEPARDTKVPANCSGTYKSIHVYANGVFYWAVDDHIVSFDLNTETFHILQTPDIGRDFDFCLLALFGSLCLVERVYKSSNGSLIMGGTNFWSMVRGEWEKVFTLNDEPDFDWFLDQANLLFYRDSHSRLAAYDVKTEKISPVDDSKGLLNEEQWCFGHKVHVNSFLSLNCMLDFSGGV